MEETITLDPLYEILKQDSTAASSEARSSIHRAIIKKFFRASEVSIKKVDTKYKIKVWPMLSTKKTASFIFNIPQSQMHQFIETCIKNDTKGRGFYTGMMQYLQINRP